MVINVPNALFYFVTDNNRHIIFIVNISILMRRPKYTNKICSNVLHFKILGFMVKLKIGLSLKVQSVLNNKQTQIN